MKLQFTTILFILCFNNINAQQTHWAYTNSNFIEENDFFGSAVEDSSANIFTIFYQWTKDYIPNYKTKIYKVNKNGILQNSSAYLNIDSNCNIRKLFILPNQHIIVIGMSGRSSRAYSNVFFTEFDNNLNILYTKKHPILGYTSDSMITSGPNVIKTIQNTFLLTFNLGSPYIVSINYAKSATKFFELTIHGDLIRQVSIGTFTNPTVLTPHSFIQDPKSKNYKITHAKPISGMENLFTHDFKTLQIIDSFLSIPGPINHYSDIKLMNDSSYLMTYEFDSYIPLVKFNMKNNSKLKSTGSKFTSQDLPVLNREHIPAIFEAIDFVSSNKIYIGGNCFKYKDEITYKKGTKIFMGCSQIDSNLNIKWTRFVGGESTYHVYSVLATNDGGVVLLGAYDKYPNIIYSPDPFYNFMDPIMVKIGPNGEVLNTNELPKGTQVFSYLVGPNPVQNILNIQGFTPNTTIQIVNSLGQVVMQQPITQQQTELNLSRLNAGVYFYRFSSPNGFILQSGKLVKA